MKPIRFKSLAVLGIDTERIGTATITTTRFNMNSVQSHTLFTSYPEIIRHPLFYVSGLFAWVVASVFSFVPFWVVIYPLMKFLNPAILKAPGPLEISWDHAVAGVACLLLGAVVAFFFAVFAVIGQLESKLVNRERGEARWRLVDEDGWDAFVASLKTPGSKPY